MVQILWDFRGESTCLEDTEDLVSGDEADLGDAVGVTQHNTDLGGRHSPAGEFVDLFDDFAGRGFEPGGGSSGVWEGGGRNALAWSVHTTWCELAWPRSRAQEKYPWLMSVVVGGGVVDGDCN